ncbi:MAG TPA: hypothetical protein VMH48_01645, partial [Methylomirabilota bacterium]|nr:hypothetical protein [Methylomirabilota bacterium]
YVTSVESTIERAVAMGAELFLGVVLLLGTVWLATHLAVRIFSPKEPPPLPSFDVPSKAPSQGGPVV